MVLRPLFHRSSYNKLDNRDNCIRAIHFSQILLVKQIQSAGKLREISGIKKIIMGQS